MARNSINRATLSVGSRIGNLGQLGQCEGIMDDIANSVCVIGDKLFHRFGTLIPGRDLQVLLGFPTLEAFAQARRSGRLPIRTFKLPGRRGVFADSGEVAAWLTQIRAAKNGPASPDTFDEKETSMT